MGTEMMNPLDAAFLLGETDTHLAHVGGLMIFRLPPEAQRDYVHRLVNEMRGYREPIKPFDRRPSLGALGRVPLRWEIVSDLNIDFHLRHSALPWPGDQQELGILVSRLHGSRLDRSRPLWTCYFIEGLEDDRLAVYLQAHHALTDGMGAIRLVQDVLSEDPDEREMPPPWACRDTDPTPDREDPPRERLDWTSTLARQAVELREGAQAQMGSLPALARMYAGVGLPKAARELFPWLRVQDDLARPYTAPHSILNGSITAHRRIATQSYSMNRLLALAGRTGGTVNDIVLAICAGGVRRYLSGLDALPEHPLIAGMPTSFRAQDSSAAEGNAITFGLASLATDIADVRERFAAITASAGQAKEHMSRLPKAAMMSYTALLMAPMALGLVSGVGSHVRPMFNLIISNVPGPPRPLYLNGLLLEEIYPASVPLTGQALNITVLSYADRMNVSFTACGTTLPHLQHLALHCGDALAELEQAFAS